MSEVLRFNEDHLWVRPEKGMATIGVSNYAQEELGDIVSVDLPEVDDRIEKGDPIGEIESVKTVSELISPVTGKVLSVNRDLKDNPAIINDDPYGDGWVLQVTVEDPSEINALMTQDEYEKHTKEGG